MGNLPPPPRLGAAFLCNPRKSRKVCPRQLPRLAPPRNRRPKINCLSPPDLVCKSHFRMLTTARNSTPQNLNISNSPAI
ncbi:hypothetical protein DSO57_1018609 [Entomophthora muscae]|uniref:Uncharacterized protein n=1 Tax=Entomophthora muscae TaxID=34485 RepID=A0ACC2RVJ8_9FUNG|nr:hypothetical protein DSO57_1018609 [Entomophthora muscae]